MQAKRLGEFIVRFILRTAALLLFYASVCLADSWELGATGGFGWYNSPSIRNATGSIEAGIPAKGAIGVTLTEDITKYIGGEIRYLFRFGGPQLESESSGTRVNLGGHTNIITYDFLFYTPRRESRVRGFVSGGAGIKVFTGNGSRFAGFDQPLANFALLRSKTQVEPAISAGAGVKFRLWDHVVLRLEFRSYMTPLPDEVFRPAGLSRIHGWLYDFVPLGGIGYVF